MTSRSLVWATKSYYDIQKLRLALGNRKPKGGKAAEIVLDPVDLALLESLTDGMQKLETEAKRHVEAVVKNEPMYAWLSDIKGIGGLLAAVMLTEFDPHKARHASSFWHYAGLIPGTDGKAIRPVKGSKLTYNKWLKAKMLAGGVGTGILKACMRSTEVGEPAPYRICKKTGEKKYSKGWVPWGVMDAYAPISTKKRLAELQAAGATIVEDTIQVKGEPTLCQYHVTQKQYWMPEGPEGRYVQVYYERKRRCEQSKWGNSHGHRHLHSMRIMVKQLLADFWAAWRTQQGLPVSVPYAEAKLGLKHGA